MKLRAGSTEEAGIWSETVQQIRKRAQMWVSEGSTPALVLVAARHGVIFLHEAFGRHTPEKDSVRLAKNALFPLASMSKTITATAVMILVEDGLLGLNRPVQEYIPEFQGKGKEEVMVHQLLTHTSGLRNDEWMEIMEEEGDVVEVPPPEKTMHPGVNKFLNPLYKSPLGYSTGAEMVYSDANYYLAGELVRRLSGQSLDQFTRERIFNPLGMNDTYYIVPQEVQDRVVRLPEDAPGYEYLDKEFMERPSPSGGAFSTALDMAKFGQMFLNGGKYGRKTILSPATVAAMTRDQIPGVSASFVDMFIPYASWGLGWSIGASYKGRVYGEFLPAPCYFNHGGFGGVEMWVDPAREIVGVYFSVALDVDSRDFSIQDADLFMNMVTAGAIDDGKPGVTLPSSRNPLHAGRKRQDRDLVLQSGAPEEAGADPVRVQKIIDLAKDWVTSGLHPSLNIIAARHRVVFLDKSFGRSGPEEDAQPLKPDALFPLASITKPILATAAMILVEEGLLSLNRPVKEYIPEFKGEGQEQVLIRHLLTHTSGFGNADIAKLAKDRGMIAEPELSEQNRAKLYRDYDAYMGLIYALPSPMKPDQTMIYSQLNYDLLAEVISRTSGSTFPEFVHQRIFEPLGMKDSYLTVPENKKMRVVLRPDFAPYNEFLTVILHTDSPTGNSGFSSVMNMAIFGQMFLNGGSYGGERILSTAAVEAMTRDQVPGIKAEFMGETFGQAEWGLGWSIYQAEKSWAYGEPLLSQGSYCHGGVGGVFFWIDPVRDLVAVFFSTYLSLNEAERPVVATDLFINSVLASIVDD